MREMSKILHYYFVCFAVYDRHAVIIITTHKKDETDFEKVSGERRVTNIFLVGGGARGPTLLGSNWYKCVFFS